MAEYEFRWTSRLDDAWESDTHTYPSRVELFGEGVRGGPNAHVVFEMRNGVPEVVDFKLTSREDGRAVRTADLGGWQLEGLAINAFRRWARLSDPAEARKLMDATGAEDPYGALDERDHWAIGGTLEAAKATRSGPSEAELKEVAQIYKNAIEGRPTEAVQITLGYSRRTAARRVQQARVAGLLPETTPGKKNA